MKNTSTGLVPLRRYVRDILSSGYSFRNARITSSLQEVAILNLKHAPFLQKKVQRLN